MAQVAELIGADVLGESHPEACSAVVKVLRDRALVIVCMPQGCSVTDTAEDVVEGTTDGVQKLSFVGLSRR